MLLSLMVTALLMGLAGSPHCLAMCGAACAAASGRGGFESRPVGRGLSPFAWLMLGRLLGYAVAGAVVAASLGLLGGWAERTAWIRPLWAMAQVGAFSLGLWLLWQGRQPAWLEQFGRKATAADPAGWRPLVGPIRQGAVGMAWALLPCGLLQSALVVAALAGDALGGAAVMASFAIGSGLVLGFGPRLWAWVVQRRASGPLAGRSAAALEARWPIRLAGGLLAVAAFWALWHGFGVASGLCQPLL